MLVRCTKYQDLLCLLTALHGECKHLFPHEYVYGCTDDECTLTRKRLYNVTCVKIGERHIKNE
jgi:hypothetical protein